MSDRKYSRFYGDVIWEMEEYINLKTVWRRHFYQTICLLPQASNSGIFKISSKTLSEKTYLNKVLVEQLLYCAPAMNGLLSYHEGFLFNRPHFNNASKVCGNPAKFVTGILNEVREKESAFWPEFFKINIHRLKAMNEKYFKDKPDKKTAEINALLEIANSYITLPPETKPSLERVTLASGEVLELDDETRNLILKHQKKPQ